MNPRVILQSANLGPAMGPAGVSDRRRQQQVAAGASSSEYGGAPMNFQQNLFISYAHIDDQPLTPGEKGWISRFHTTLKKILDMRMGGEAKIWRDEKLQGND